MAYLLLVASVVLAGCSLPDKDACRTADDCFAGRACVDGRCVAGAVDLGIEAGAPADLASGGSDGPSGCDSASCPTGTCEAGQCLPGRWSARMPMPTARAGLAAAFAGDGMLYALGGYQSGTVVEAYDPTKDSWSSAPPMPHARYEFGAVLGSDGQLYAVGGPYTSVNDPGVSHLVDAYAPATRMWTAAPSLGTGRSSAAAVVGSDGAIYAIAGFDPGTFAVTDTVEKLAGGQWTMLATHLLTARQEHVAVALADGKMFALGGIGGFSSPRLASVEWIAANGTSFVAAQPMSLARDMFAAAVAGGRIYVIGGNAAQSGPTNVLGLVEAYDPATQSWTRVASLPTPRYGLAAAAGSDGKIYVVGGHDSTSVLPTLEVLTP